MVDMMIGVYTRHVDGSRTVRVPTCTVTGDETTLPEVRYSDYCDCPKHQGRAIDDRRRGVEFL
ncbi:hypothetical protein [Streptomyces sp. NPDC095613]|uniref:hypothetical protein n=1 Tax=Streptomyces sp. NPDC095613 TaxID=3155540 RepID=UPI003327102C